MLLDFAHAPPRRRKSRGLRPGILSSQAWVLFGRRMGESGAKILTPIGSFSSTVFPDCGTSLGPVGAHAPAPAMIAAPWDAFGGAWLLRGNASIYLSPAAPKSGVCDGKLGSVE